MKPTRRLILAALCLTSLLLLTACSTRLMWVGTRGSNSLEASFASFNGSESKTLAIESPTLLELKYSVNLTKGELAIQLFDQKGEWILEKTFTESSSGMESILLPEKGHYLLVINGAWASGDYQLSWVND